ncbi:MAG TPA: DNA replication/repair protein RecF [Actinomycetes bacterium]|jgi:DNA replication and repair protein RecF
MRVARIELVDFRSYPHVDVTLDAGVSAFIGPNGQGKTNLVEAVAYVATLSSHRVATDAPLIRLGGERAIIRVAVVKDDREIVVEIEVQAGRSNRARLNRTPLPRSRDVLGVLRTVTFAPEDLSLIKGDPAERRRYLDELLIARAPRFAGVRHDYDRVVKQRTALLKTAAQARRAGRSVADLRTLDVWDAHLARIGAEVLTARLELVQSIGPLVDKAYESLAGETSAGPVVMEYRSSMGADLPSGASREVVEAALLAQAAASRVDEMDRGVCLVGPHRDDLVLRLGPLPARGYASHGEAWAYALGLRLAAYDLLAADGAQPVLLLDDVFAELDVGRRERLAQLVRHAEQVIVTAAVPDDVPESLDGARFDVMAGEVRRVR